jgi:hypothetical protein
MIQRLLLLDYPSSVKKGTSTTEAPFSRSIQTAAFRNNLFGEGLLFVSRNCVLEKFSPERHAWGGRISKADTIRLCISFMTIR